MWWEDALSEVFHFVILRFTFGMMSMVFPRVWQNHTLP